MKNMIFGETPEFEEIMECMERLERDQWAVRVDLAGQKAEIFLIQGWIQSNIFPHFLERILTAKTHDAVPSMYTSHRGKIMVYSLKQHKNRLWKKTIWDDVLKKMIMGQSKLIELMLLYIYNRNILTDGERKKVIDGLQSNWSLTDKEQVQERLDAIINGDEFAQRIINTYNLLMGNL